jgi:hypothetical protein
MLHHDKLVASALGREVECLNKHSKTWGAAVVQWCRVRKEMKCKKDCGFNSQPGKYSKFFLNLILHFI